jgi:chromosome segregation ATPase
MLLPFQDGFTAELSRERDELKAKLESCKAALREAEGKLEISKEDNKQLQYRLERLDEKLEAKDRYGTANAHLWC